MPRGAQRQARERRPPRRRTASMPRIGGVCVALRADLLRNPAQSLIKRRAIVLPATDLLGSVPATSHACRLAAQCPSATRSGRQSRPATAERAAPAAPSLSTPLHTVHRAADWLGASRKPMSHATGRFASIESREARRSPAPRARAVRLCAALRRQPEAATAPQRSSSVKLVESSNDGPARERETRLLRRRLGRRRSGWWGLLPAPPGSA